MAAEPFWKTTPLTEMNKQQWESLCDGCGKCCLNKIEDEDTDEILYTRISCVLLDTQSCQCSDYPRRFNKVPDCIQLKPDLVDQFHWLPATCAYRRLSEGKELPHWHPLLSGSAESVHEAGVSVRGWAVSEKWVDEDDWYDYVIEGVEF